MIWIKPRGRLGLKKVERTWTLTCYAYIQQPDRRRNADRKLLVNTNHPGNNDAAPFQKALLGLKSLRDHPIILAKQAKNGKKRMKSLAGIRGTTSDIRSGPMHLQAVCFCNKILGDWSPSILRTCSLLR